MKNTSARSPFLRLLRRLNKIYTTKQNNNYSNIHQFISSKHHNSKKHYFADKKGCDFVKNDEVEESGALDELWAGCIVLWLWLYCAVAVAVAVLRCGVLYCAVLCCAVLWL